MFLHSMNMVVKI